MDSLSIYEFRNAIKSFTNESVLPDEVKRMVLEDILREQLEKTIETLKEEIEERDREGVNKK